MNLKEQLDDVIKKLEHVYYDMFVSASFEVMEVYILNYRENIVCPYANIADETTDEIKGVFSSIEKAREHLKLLYKGDVSQFDINNPIEQYDTYFYRYYLIKAKVDEFLT